MTAVIVTPGGLGATYLPHIDASARIIPGAHRGEAAVDFILTSDPDAIRQLRKSSLPVIGVMALVAHTETITCDALRESVQHSIHWDAALALWRSWSAEARNLPGVFRVTALRADGLKEPRVNDIARAGASGVSRAHPHWHVHMTQFDIEVCVLWLSTTLLVGLPLTPGWQACVRVAKGGFFPIEEQWTAMHHDPSQPVLRPSICHALLRHADLKPTDLACDPMCGVGSVPAEALRRFGGVYCLAGDNGRSAVRAAGQRARKSRLPPVGVAVGVECGAEGGNARVRLRLSFVRSPCLEVVRWDVRQLPLRSGVLDVLVADMPWGNKSKSDPTLLRDALCECARVLTVGGVAVLLMLRTTATQLERMHGSSPVRVVRVQDVCVGGWPVAAVTLRKELPLPAVTDADDEVGGRSTTTTSLDATSPAAAAVRTSSCCSAVQVTAPLAALSLGELLVATFPLSIPNLSTARRAVRHQRACLMSSPEVPLWWRARVGEGEELVIRPHPDRYQPTDVLAALHAASPLEILWETGAWLCARKPPGMDVQRGKRSLAHALLALQQSRQAASTGGGGTGGDIDGVEAPRGASCVPWTPAYSGACRVGGAWLCAKTPRSALAVLDGRVRLRLSWRAILVGTPTVAMLEACGLAGVVLGASSSSVRFGALTEASFCTAHTDTHTWRDAVAGAGHPVCGDRPHSLGPTACMWVCAVEVQPGVGGDDGDEDLAARGPSAIIPERFAKLFEREAAVCEAVARGEVTSEYVLRLLREKSEELVAEEGDDERDDAETEAEGDVDLM